MPHTLVESWQISPGHGLDDGYTIRVIPVPEDPIGAAKGTTRGLGARLLDERL